MANLFTGGKLKAPQPQESAAARPRPEPKPAEVREPHKKEAPFVMELLSGARKAEAKFENTGEGK
jgi:hypothetical protein